MVIEEPSVVAGASFMAKLARAGGGFEATSSSPEMIGQIQVLDLADIQKAAQGSAGASGRTAGGGGLRGSRVEGIGRRRAGFGSATHRKLANRPVPRGPPAL